MESARRLLVHNPRSDRADRKLDSVVGVDPENRMYLLDLWRGQTSSDIWIEAWCDLVKKWRPSFWAQEHGQIISGVGLFLKSRAIERHAYTHREQRAQPRLGHGGAGKPRKARPWTPGRRDAACACEVIRPPKDLPPASRCKLRDCGHGSPNGRVRQFRRVGSPGALFHVRKLITQRRDAALAKLPRGDIHERVGHSGSRPMREDIAGARGRWRQ